MNFKKFLSLVLSMILVLVAVPLSGTVGEITVDALTDGYYTYSVSNRETTITAVNTSISGDIVIPSTLGGYPVTGIGEDAFFGCKSLTSIIIPDSVTNIDGYAFYNCTSLTSITIPDSVTSIGKSVFWNCPSLKSVNITDLAAWCEISFSDFVSNPLRNDGKLYINGVLATDIAIPDGATSIGSYAFYNYKSLTSITIPDSVTSIGSYAFSDCTSLANVKIGKGVTSMGKYIFYNCTSLNSITIPDSVTTIGSNTFEDCINLKSVTIGKGVTSIHVYAFEGCTTLTSIKIPNSVTSIGDYAFNKCTSLEIVYYTGTEEEWNNIYIGSSNSNLTNANIIFNYVDEHTHTGGNATCIKKAVCIVCGEEYGNLAEHNYNSVVTEPTCTEDGFTTYTCTICDDSYIDNMVDALGHEYVIGTKFCKRCELDAVEHPDFIDGEYVNGYGWADLDNDGIINYNDLNFLNEVVANVLFFDGSEACKAADVNGDGKIDMKDIVRIKKILGIIPGGGTGKYTTLTDIPNFIQQ